MNLDQINDDQATRLIEGHDRLGFFVFDGAYYWIIDWEAHFNLDHGKNLRAYFQNGHLTQKQYEKAMDEFRGGVTTLTKASFPQYRDGCFAKVLSTDVLARHISVADEQSFQSLGKSMEEELSFNTPMSADLVSLRQRIADMLPKFYVNFDRNIFMHMVRGRDYQAVVPTEWWGAECDFEHMIPISHRYWQRSQQYDLWATTNF